MGIESGEEIDFIMQPIFWNNSFTDKNLLKQAKYLASPNKNPTSWGKLTMQTFIDMDLVVPKIRKVVKSPSP